eukprot:202805_1
MGDVGSAVATPFVAVATTISGDADRKIYYDCPNCGEEVWVYVAGAAFKGRRCNRCRSNSDWFKAVSVACSDESLSAKISYYDSSKNSSRLNIVENNIDSGDCKRKIQKIRVRSIWLYHGSVSAIGSMFTGITTGNSITHWWVEIEAENRWYCAMWKNPNLVLSYHGSRDEVTSEGKSAVGARNEDKNITNKSECGGNGKTIGDLKNWMNNYIKSKGGYDVGTNNCQHFGEALYRWI